MAIISTALESNKNKPLYKKHAEIAEHYQNFVSSNKGKIKGKYDEKSILLNITFPIHTVETINITAFSEVTEVFGKKQIEQEMEFYFKSTSKLKSSFSLKEKSFMGELRTIFSKKVEKYEFDDSYIVECEDLELFQEILEYHDLTKKLINFDLDLFELDATTGRFMLRFGRFIENTYMIINILSYINNAIDNMTIKRR